MDNRFWNFGTFRQQGSRIFLCTGQTFLEISDFATICEAGIGVKGARVGV